MRTRNCRTPGWIVNWLAKWQEQITVFFSRLRSRFVQSHCSVLHHVLAVTWDTLAQSWIGNQHMFLFNLYWFFFFFYKYRISFKSDSYLGIQQSAYSSFRDATEDTNVSSRNGLALLSWWSSYASTKPVPSHLQGEERRPGGSGYATERLLPRLRLESFLSHTEQGKAFSVKAILVREVEQIAILRRIILECSITLRT